MRCFCKNNFMKSQFKLCSSEGGRHPLSSSLTDTSFVTVNKGEKRNFLTSVRVTGIKQGSHPGRAASTGLGNGSGAILFWGKPLKNLRGNGLKALCPFLRGSAIVKAVFAYCLPEGPALAGIPKFKDDLPLKLARVQGNTY